MNHMRRKLLCGKMMVILAVFLVLFMAAGYAEEGQVDASGQFFYVLEDGAATITDNVKEPNQPQQETDEVMRLAVFPTGTYGESYYFELKQDGVLFCAVGVRVSDDIAQPNFLAEIDLSAETVLSSTNFQLLLDLCDELERSGYNSPKTLWRDAWDVGALYNGKVYETIYWDSDGSRELIDLVDP